MNRPICLAGVTFTLSMATCAAYALVIGGTNFDLMGYPRPSCTKPFTKPVPPYNSNDRYEVERYNSEAESYNTQVSRYASCIRTYLENADNDIRRIRENEQEAIDEVKSL